MPSNGVVVLAALAGAAVGAGAVLALKSGPAAGAPATLEAPPAPAPRPPGAGTATADGGAGTPAPGAATAAHPPPPEWETRRAALEKENRALLEEVTSLKARVEASATATTTPPAGRAEGGAGAKTLRFGLPETTPTFDKADWGGLAGHMMSMHKVIPGLMQEMASGKDPSPATIAAIQKDNMPLAIFAVGAAAELPGTGPNGAFTHPAVIANLVRAALAAAGDPLTAEEETSIRALGNAWASEMERFGTSYGPGTPALQKLVDEVDAKIRFLRALKESLSPSQQALLFNPSTEGRVQMDLLSPGLVYVMRVPVHAKDRDALEKLLVKQLFESAGLAETDPAPYDWVGRRWLDALPASLQKLPLRSPDVLFPHVDRVQAAARAELAAVEAILALRQLPAEKAKELLNLTTVLTPQLVE